MHPMVPCLPACMKSHPPGADKFFISSRIRSKDFSRATKSVEVIVRNVQKPRMPTHWGPGGPGLAKR